MNTALKKRIVAIFCLLAGAMDASSGCLLVVAPAWTLHLMGVPPVDATSLVFIQFIGAFVFSVGSLYLFALASIFRTSSHLPLYFCLWVTGWVRLVICLFTSHALFSGTLPVEWLSVPLSDGLLAALQFWMIRRRWLWNDV